MISSPRAIMFGLLLAGMALFCGGCRKDPANACGDAEWSHVESLPGYDHGISGSQYRPMVRLVWSTACLKLSATDLACVRAMKTLDDLRKCERVYPSMGDELGMMLQRVGKPPMEDDAGTTP